MIKLTLKKLVLSGCFYGITTLFPTGDIIMYESHYLELGLLAVQLL